MGFFDTISLAFDSGACKDTQTLVQPGDDVFCICTRRTGHNGNHYDRRVNLEWGDESLVKYKDRAAHFGDS